MLGFKPLGIQAELSELSDGLRKALENLRKTIETTMFSEKTLEKP